MLGLNAVIYHLNQSPLRGAGDGKGINPNARRDSATTPLNTTAAHSL